MVRLESSVGQSCNRLPAALLNSETASLTSSSVGLFAAATTMILEERSNGWFKSDVRLDESAGGSTFAGKLVPSGGSSVISLCTGTNRAPVWVIAFFTGAEALLAVSSGVPGR